MWHTGQIAEVVLDQIDDRQYGYQKGRVVEENVEKLFQPELVLFAGRSQLFHDRLLEFDVKRAFDWFAVQLADQTGQKD